MARALGLSEDALVDEWAAYAVNADLPLQPTPAAIEQFRAHVRPAYALSLSLSSLNTFSPKVSKHSSAASMCTISLSAVCATFFISASSLLIVNLSLNSTGTS